MKFARSFIPWLAFAALAPVNWLASGLAGLLVAIVIIGRERRSRVPWEAMVMEVSALVFFVAVTVVALASPHSGLRPYSGAGSMAWLAVVAWGSLAVGRPFTLGISKQGVPPEVSLLPAFLRLNTIITVVWAVSFTVTAIVVALVYAATKNVGESALVQCAGIVIPATFTVRYVAAARARAAAGPVLAGNKH